MGLKRFVEEYSPESLLPLLKLGYRVVKFPYTCAKELSRRKKLAKILQMPINICHTIRTNYLARYYQPVKSF